MIFDVVFHVIFDVIFDVVFYVIFDVVFYVKFFNRVESIALSTFLILLLNGWQFFQFEDKPMNFIKIIIDWNDL